MAKLMTLGDFNLLVTYSDGSTDRYEGTLEHCRFHMDNECWGPELVVAVVQAADGTSRGVRYGSSEKAFQEYFWNLNAADQGFPVDENTARALFARR